MRHERRRLGRRARAVIRRAKVALVACGALLLAFITPAVIALAQAPAPVYASVGDSTGISLTSLLGILVPIAGAWASTVVYLARSKDEALRGQADAQRTERAEWQKKDRERDAFVERLVNARSEDAREARAAIIQIVGDALGSVDRIRADVERALTTPETPSPVPDRPSRTSMPSIETAGPPTQRGGRAPKKAPNA